MFAPNFVGTFDVTMKGVKILDPGQAAANVPAGGLATGYQVTYTPPKGAIKPGCTLILVQAYQFPGLFFGMSPTLDRGNVPRAANATLPSYAAACGNVADLALNRNDGCMLRDRPIDPWQLGGGTTRTIDVCAVVEDPSTTPATETILGGVAFTWDDTLGRRP